MSPRPVATTVDDAVPRGRRSRRRRGPGWVPNQHGAWAMLVVPVVVGAAAVGPTWWHGLLLVTWLVAYLAFYATGLWLRARRRPRYLPPVRAYGVATALLGVVLLVTEPGLLRWGVAYGPLLAVSLWLSARRQDRSLVSGLVTVAAACLMTVVAGGPWVAAGILFAYFAGTVLYVKTMIRERGSRPMLVASVGAHAAATVLVGLVSPWLAGLFGLLTVRAVVVPLVWPRATPRAIGFGEVAASLAVTVAVALTALAG